MNFDIDNSIIIGFLIITFITGIKHARGITTFKEYALGGRNFSTGAIVATVIATWIGGGSFFTILSRTYTDGLYFVIAISGMFLSFSIFAFFLIPRMGEFLGLNSIAESMGSLYGQNVRIITAIAGIISSIGFIAVQFKVFGSLFSYFLGFSSTEAILITAMLVTTYSAFGGIKSVTFTDIIQIFTFGISIPIIGIMIWNQSYYDGFSFANSLADPKFNFSKVLDLGNPRFLQMIPLILYFSLPSLQPDIYQRVLIGRNLQQLKRVFLITACSLLVIILLLAWIPFLIFNVDSNIEPNQLLGYIFDNYTYTGLKGLLVAGIVAMAMSSADSYINSSAVLFSNDICTPLNFGKNKKLLLSKLFAFFLGILGVVLALSEQDLLSIILTTNSFYMPIVTVPLMFSILGFRSSTKSVLIGMGAGFITVVTWKLLGIDANCIVFAMFVNLIFLMGSHYLLKQKGGWVGIKDKAAFDNLKQEEINYKKERTRRLRNISIIGYCKKHFPSNDLSYVGLGIYIMVYTIATMYSTRAELRSVNSQMILAFYQIMLVSGTLLFVYPIWPRSINPDKKQTFAQVVWPIVIAYTLIFFSGFFLLVSEFNTVQFSMFTMNLLIASFLLGWRIFGIFTMIGLYMAFKIHQAYYPNYIIDIYMGSPAFIATYILMLVGASTVLFIKPRQEHLEDTEDKVIDLDSKVVHYGERIIGHEQEIERLSATSQKILNKVSHELRLPVGNVNNFSEMLHEHLSKSSDKYIQELSKELHQNSTRLSSMILNMLDLATLEVKKIDLKKQTINFSELVENRIAICKKIYLQNKPIVFDYSIAPKIMIAVDANYIRQTIDNLVINAIKFSQQGMIKVSVQKKKGEVIFTIRDQGLGIPKEELLDVFEAFKMGSNTESKAEGRGVGLALCKSVIQAHRGTITAESDGEKGATLKFVLSFSN